MTPSQKPEGIERFTCETWSGHGEMDPGPHGDFVRFSDHQERVKELEGFVSAAKQWRQATESRLRMLDSRGEAAKAMLKADRDLIEAMERVDG